MDIIINNIPILWTFGIRKPSIKYLSMNWYRNANYRDLSKVKKSFTELLILENNGVEYNILTSPVFFEYTMYWKDNRMVDLGNIGAVVDKFTADVVVKLGILKDDNTDFIKKVSYVDGGVDKDNPRADLLIKSIGKNE